MKTIILAEHSSSSKPKWLRFNFIKKFIYKKLFIHCITPVGLKKKATIR
jgi:hypothetical protein